MSSERYRLVGVGMAMMIVVAAVPAEATPLRRIGERTARADSASISPTDERIVREQRRAFGERLRDGADQSRSFAQDGSGRVNVRVLTRQNGRLNTRLERTQILAGEAAQGDGTRVRSSGQRR